MSDLKKLRELAEKATPGPWSYDADEDEIHSDACATSDGEPWHVIPSQASQSIASIRDSYFIAAANPQAIIEILDRLERYEKALIEFADYDNQYEPNMVCWPASDYMRKAREALEGGK